MKAYEGFSCLFLLHCGVGERASSKHRALATHPGHALTVETAYETVLHGLSSLSHSLLPPTLGSGGSWVPGAPRLLAMKRPSFKGVRRTTLKSRCLSLQSLAQVDTAGPGHEWQGPLVLLVQSKTQHDLSSAYQVTPDSMSG